MIGLYKNECVKPDGPFRTVDDLELATLSWVHLSRVKELAGFGLGEVGCRGVYQSQVNVQRAARRARASCGLIVLYSIR